MKVKSSYNLTGIKLNKFLLTTYKCFEKRLWLRSKYFGVEPNETGDILRLALKIKINYIDNLGQVRQLNVSFQVPPSRNNRNQLNSKHFTLKIKVKYICDQYISN